jgi:HemY protein
MKRLFFYLLLAAIIVAGYAMYTNQDLGLMQVSFAGHSYRATLFEVGVGALALLLTWLVLSYTFQLLKTFSERFGEKRGERLAEKVQHAQAQGLIELAEGRFDKAEKLLLYKIEHNENTLSNYLAAARAAHDQGAHDRRDDYFRQAQIMTPDAALAIGLTQAELQLDHNQFKQALATLNRLNEQAPLHACVLKLLARTYCNLADWDRLRELLPDVQRVEALGDEKLLSLEIETWCGLIADRAKTGHVDSLTLLWDEMPGNIKVIPEVIEHYANGLVRLHASGEAEQVLRDYLDNHWAESTVMLYAELDVMATDEQIGTAESWLKNHPHNEHLLLALGKMCISKNNWGKARGYLEASLSVTPMPATYLKLAQLLEDHMDDPLQAKEYYRQGLHMLSGDYGEQALANAEKDFERIIMQPELRVI